MFISVHVFTSHAQDLTLNGNQLKNNTGCDESNKNRRTKERNTANSFKEHDNIQTTDQQHAKTNNDFESRWSGESFSDERGSTVCCFNPYFIMLFPFAAWCRPIRAPGLSLRPEQQSRFSLTPWFSAKPKSVGNMTFLRSTEQSFDNDGKKIYGS